MNTFFDDDIFKVNDIYQDLEDLANLYCWYDYLVLISGWHDDNEEFSNFLKSFNTDKFGFIANAVFSKDEKKELFWIEKRMLKDEEFSTLNEILPYCPILNVTVFYKDKKARILKPLFRYQVNEENMESFQSLLKEKTNNHHHGIIEPSEGIEDIFSDILFDNTYWKYVSSVLPKAKEFYKCYYPFQVSQVQK